MKKVPLNPEDLFWHRIRLELRNPLPRQIFADWCDENDQLEMAELQRWLAATRRRPHLRNGFWLWIAEGFETGLPEIAGLVGWPDDFSVRLIFPGGFLPRKLFEELQYPSSGFLQIFAPGILVYESLRDAEKALCEAWKRTARKPALSSAS